MEDEIRCSACSGGVSWRDCDRHDPYLFECYATECDNCGRLDRDCEEVKL